MKPCVHTDNTHMYAYIHGGEGEFLVPGQCHALTGTHGGGAEVGHDDLSRCYIHTLSFVLTVQIVDN